MIPEGTKSSREVPGNRRYPFACLRPFLDGSGQDVQESFPTLAQALATYDATCRVHVRLVDGDETVTNWEIEGGPDAAAARRTEPATADVLLVVSVETWSQIAQGLLAPFAALFDGKLRVGGDLELATRLARHLSDPTVPFVAPC